MEGRSSGLKDLKVEKMRNRNKICTDLSNKTLW